LLYENIALVHGSPVNLCPLNQGLPRRTAERSGRGPVRHASRWFTRTAPCWFPRQRRPLGPRLSPVAYPASLPETLSRLAQSAESRATLSALAPAGMAGAGAAGVTALVVKVPAAEGAVRVLRPAATWRKRKCSAITLAA